MSARRQRNNNKQIPLTDARIRWVENDNGPLRSGANLTWTRYNGERNDEKNVGKLHFAVSLPRKLLLLTQIVSGREAEPSRLPAFFRNIFNPTPKELHPVHTLQDQGYTRIKDTPTCDSRILSK